VSRSLVVRQLVPRRRREKPNALSLTLAVLAVLCAFLATLSGHDEPTPKRRTRKYRRRVIASPSFQRAEADRVTLRRLVQGGAN
jgi:hypothetical protein